MRGASKEVGTVALFVEIYVVAWYVSSGVLDIIGHVKVNRFGLLEELVNVCLIAERDMMGSFPGVLKFTTE